MTVVQASVFLDSTTLGEGATKVGEPIASTADALDCVWQLLDHALSAVVTDLALAGAQLPLAQAAILGHGDGHHLHQGK